MTEFYVLIFGFVSVWVCFRNNINDHLIFQNFHVLRRYYHFNGISIAAEYKIGEDSQKNSKIMEISFFRATAAMVMKKYDCRTHWWGKGVADWRSSWFDFTKYEPASILAIDIDV